MSLHLKPVRPHDWQGVHLKLIEVRLNHLSRREFTVGSFPTVYFRLPHDPTQ